MKKRMLSLAVLAASLFCFSNGANAQKTEKLFNGKDLSNWNFVVDKNSVPADQVYSVRDGKIFITGQAFSPSGLSNLRATRLFSFCAPFCGIGSTLEPAKPASQR